MKRSVLVLILAFLGAASPGMRAEAQDRALTPEWVQQFEQSLDLNETLGNESSYDSRLSLESYARYYEIGIIDGVTLVSAVYAPPVERHPEDWTTCTSRNGALTDCSPSPQPTDEELRTRGRGVHIGEPFPMIFDGGCGVVTLRIEPETLRVVSAYCNGQA